MERLSSSVSMVIQLCKPVSLRIPDDREDSSPKHWFEIVLHGTKSLKATVNDTAMKVSQKTMLFNH
jgi:hypothetical protein